MAYDLPDLLGRWFHYALSLGKRKNPLLAGVAMPSASYAQLAYDAAGIDLSPGATQRNVSVAPTPSRRARGIVHRASPDS